MCRSGVEIPLSNIHYYCYYHYNHHHRYIIFILYKRKKKTVFLYYVTVFLHFDYPKHINKNIIRKFRPFSWWYTFELDNEKLNTKKETQSREKNSYLLCCVCICLFVFLCVNYMSYAPIYKWISLSILFNTFPIENEPEPFFFIFCLLLGHGMAQYVFVCLAGFRRVLLCFAFAFVFVMLRERTVINYDEQLLSENKTCKLQQRD